MLEGEMKMVDYGLFMDGVQQGAEVGANIASTISEHTLTSKKTFQKPNNLLAQDVVDTIEE